MTTARVLTCYFKILIIICCYILGIILLPVVAIDYFKMFGYDSSGQALELPMVCKVLTEISLSFFNMLIRPILDLSCPLLF